MIINFSCQYSIAQEHNDQEENEEEGCAGEHCRMFFDKIPVIHNGSIMDACNRRWIRVVCYRPSKKIHLL
jgi:hypothetical protein